jgi:phospholipid/cholesterol/gamma-HCH transport system substrate-binding protein
MPQNKQPGFSQLRVGLLVLMALGILVFVIFAISGDVSLPGFGKKTTIRTEMASVDGLREGAEVRLSGKKVGSVKEINFTNQIPDNPNAQNNVEIVMEIDGKLDGRPAIERIRQDSMAVLKSAGVLGDNVIDIVPGTTKGAPVTDGAKIQSQAQKSVGDIINAAQTAVGNLNTISDDIKVMTGDLRTGKGSMGKFLNDDAFYLNLNKTVLSAEKTMTSFRDGDGTTAKLIKDPELYNKLTDTIAQLRGIADQVNTQLASGKGTVSKLLKDEEIYNKANSLVAKLDQFSNRLDRTMASVEAGEGNLGKLVRDEELYREARDTIAKFRVITDKLEKGEGTAGMLLKDDRLYNNVNNVSAEVTKLLYDFRQNPKKYLSVKLAVF